MHSYIIHIISKIQRKILPNLLAYNEKGKPFWVSLSMLWRKVRDSNPRYPKGVYRISSPAHSVTLPTFHCAS